MNFHSKKNPGITRDGIDAIVAGLNRMTVKERRQLPGVSEIRAHQIVAGALVAQQVMKTFSLDVIQTCPWALREGIVLRRMDWIR
jgi:exopolyphosphatase/guanosine-5'-triphosphate,3'-diphosphate pyrophosphatase